MMEHQSNKLDVFEFSDHDYVDVNPWKNKLSKPKSHADSELKYKFLMHATSGSVIQAKEVTTVELDEDDLEIISADPQGSLYKECLNGPGGFEATPDRSLEQHCPFTEGSIGEEIPSSYLPSVGLTAAKDVSPMIEELLGTTGSGDSRDMFGNDCVQESSPSTSASDPEDDSEPVVGKAQNHFTCDFEMDDTDNVIVHTDYIRYSNKYFPASVVVFSRDSIKMKASTLEEKSVASSAVWNLDDILRIESHCSGLAEVAKVSIRLLNAIQMESADGLSGVDLVEFLVHGLEWQERIMSLNLRYKALLSIGMKNVFTYSGISHDGDVPLEEREWCTDPYIPNFEEPFEEVVYPKGDRDAVSVRKSDVDLLQPEVFVNDTIIDFYINYLKNHIPPNERQRYHFFSSFFFRKLADLDKNPSSISDGKAAFQRVRRWTRKVNIFEKDFIFIPVNYNLHWSLIVLCHLGEVACFNDENIDESSKVPCILHMDSIRGSHAGLKGLLQSYLLEEWKEREKEAAEDIWSKFLNLRFLSLELPQQENASDCGLFLLHYAELFIAEAPPNFSPFWINEFDNFLKPDWFMPAEASLKRVHIQRLIYELLARRSNERASLSGNSLSHCPAFAESNENDNGFQILSEKRNLQKSSNINSLYSEPVQGMGLDLHSLSPSRDSHNVDHSGLGMSELLEQCQPLDQEASRVQLGFAMSTSRDIEGSLHHTYSTFETEFQPGDRIAAGECHGGYSSSDCDEVFPFNYNISDHGDRRDDSPRDSRFFNDDFTEEMGIFEVDGGNQIFGSSQNGDVDQSEELLDSSAEGYASASSDVMETPAEDSQEMAKKYGKSDQEDSVNSFQENLVESCQDKLVKVENAAAVVHEKLLVGDSKVEDEVVAGLDDSLLVDDSSSDSDNEPPTKRKQPTPSVGEEHKFEGEALASLNHGLLVDALSSESDDERPAKRIQPIPSRAEESKFEDGILPDTNAKLVVDCSSSDSDDEEPAKRKRPTPSSDAEHEAGAGLANLLVGENSCSDSDNEQPTKRIRHMRSQD